MPVYFFFPSNFTTMFSSTKYNRYSVWTEHLLSLTEEKKVTLMRDELDTVGFLLGGYTRTFFHRPDFKLFPFHNTTKANNSKITWLNSN